MSFGRIPHHKPNVEPYATTPADWCDKESWSLSCEALGISRVALPDRIDRAKETPALLKHLQIGS
ncbi:hypothetical protein CEE69_19445 [Rhodopirellula bahusiensis]|uniref:Uncharacterized protein n=1 Tax=Rhodopirellula bahusiensis TaxID=2014065 RepID=A0A2G1W3Z1_9BACT|nr:hypothetical protein CEE69_19445 [Rhodopirellula bahusiensis]